MSLKVPEEKQPETQLPSSLPKTGSMEERQVVCYNPRMALPPMKTVELIFHECISQLMQRSLEYEKYASLHLPQRGGRLFLLTGTSTAGKTSITKQLAKEVEGLVELSLDEYWDAHHAEMDAELIRKEAPEIYEPLFAALDHPADVAIAIFTDDKVHWKSGISKKVLADAEKALKIGRSRRDSFPTVSMGDVRERMMKEAIEQSSSGKTVILDVWGPNDADRFVQHMIEKNNYAPLKRGLAYCPFHILSERVRKRNLEAIASGHREDCRNPLNPLDQFCGFYKPAQSGDKVIDILHRNRTVGPDGKQIDGVEEAFEFAFQQALDVLAPDAATDSAKEIEEKTARIAELRSSRDTWKHSIMDALGFSGGATEVPITLRNKSIDYVFNTYVMKPSDTTEIIREWK